MLTAIRAGMRRDRAIRRLRLKWRLDAMHPNALPNTLPDTYLDMDPT